MRTPVGRGDVVQAEEHAVGWHAQQLRHGRGQRLRSLRVAFGVDLADTADVNERAWLRKTEKQQQAYKVVRLRPQTSSDFPSSPAIHAPHRSQRRASVGRETIAPSRKIQGGPARATSTSRARGSRWRCRRQSLGRCWTRGRMASSTLWSGLDVPENWSIWK